MRTLKCVVVDDEDLGRSVLTSAIAEDRDLVVVGEAANGQEAFTLIQEQVPDLLFLDIEMPGISGFELLEMLRFEGVSAPVTVFVTAYDRYALQAFEEHAVDYLLKPFDEVRFRKAVDVAKQRARADKRADSRIQELLASVRTSRIAVRSQGRISFVRLETIDWVEARGNYLVLHVGAAEHLIRETMHSFEERLAAFPFVRIHRSAIVNIDRIVELQPWYTGEYIVRLDTGKELTLSRTYRDSLLSLIRNSKKPERDLTT
jgi:two-component system LytT family response regulator